MNGMEWSCEFFGIFVSIKTKKHSYCVNDHPTELLTDFNENETMIWHFTMNVGVQYAKIKSFQIKRCVVNYARTSTIFIQLTKYITVK